MNAPKSSDPILGSTLTKVGLCLTALWLSVAILILATSWSETMQPNAWGDFVAGMCAPLAFLWLVLGYFQQGIELRQNTEALRLQGEALHLQVEELKASVEQQRQLVAVATEDMHMNRSEYDRRRWEDQLRAQPVFRLKGSSLTTRSDGFVRRTTTIRNDGRPAGSPFVVLQGQSNGAVMRTHMKDTKVWETGGEFHFDIDIPVAVANSGVLQCKLEYTDDQGERQSQCLEFTNGLAGPSSVAFRERSIKAPAPLTIPG